MTYPLGSAHNWHRTPIYNTYSQGDSVRDLDFLFSSWVFYKIKLSHGCGFLWLVGWLVFVWFWCLVFWQACTLSKSIPWFLKTVRKKKNPSAKIFKRLIRTSQKQTGFHPRAAYPLFLEAARLRKNSDLKKQWGRTRWEHCGWYFNLAKGWSKLAQPEGEKTYHREMDCCLLQGDNGDDKDVESFVLASQ